MEQIASRAKWFFSGVRLIVPLVPSFVRIAFSQLYKSTVDYWEGSQRVVDEITEEYVTHTPLELTSDYDPYPYWLCYSVAALLYLVGWLAMSWLSVEAYRLLIGLVSELIHRLISLLPLSR